MVRVMAEVIKMISGNTIPRAIVGLRKLPSQARLAIKPLVFPSTAKVIYELAVMAIIKMIYGNTILPMIHGYRKRPALLPGTVALDLVLEAKDMSVPVLMAVT